YNREQHVISDFEKENGLLYESGWKSQFFSGLLWPLMTFVGNLGYVLVVIAGSYLSIHGALTIGDIQAFVVYIRNFTQPITNLAQVINQVQSMAAAAERVFNFLEIDNESDNGTLEIPDNQIKGEVSFEHVKFGYDPNQTIINDFSIDVKPGQKIAIVGPTGAGKTTIVKLLLRFYDVDSGAIKVDEHNIQDFKRTNLRQHFGMVLQDTWLFNGSIMENLRYGDLNASDEEVIEAAKAAHVDHFIKTLPDGYEALMNENSDNISQGQKQLLTIARAILADRPILILDEATSSVDTRTESLIQSAMDHLMAGRTSFIIAHRLSTIRNADTILVMRDGDIVEQGNHEELLEKNGFYADLYNSQFSDAAE
ncbi:MAG: ABC transporter ATP-binding protein, partial [Bavariicoccus seileri]